MGFIFRRLKKVTDNKGAILMEVLVGITIMGILLIAFYNIVVASDIFYRKAAFITEADEALFVTAETSTNDFEDALPSAALFVGPAAGSGTDKGGITLYINVDSTTGKMTLGEKVPAVPGEKVTRNIGEIGIADTYEVGGGKWIKGAKAIEFSRDDSDPEGLSNLYKIKKQP